MMKTTKSGKVRLYLRLAPRAHQKLKQLARRTGLSMSELVRIAIRREIRREGERR